MRSPAFVRKRPSGASVADAKGIGAESAFGGLSAYAAELVLTLFVFFMCANSSWNSSPPIGGGTSFPSSRAALFFLVPRTSFPSFPSSRFSAVWVACGANLLQTQSSKSPAFRSEHSGSGSPQAHLVRLMHLPSAAAPSPRTSNNRG